MAAPTYPGDVVNGDVWDAATINGLIKPLWQTINGVGVSSPTGITDDNVVVGSLSANRISGTAVTQTATETITGNKTLTGGLNINSRLAIMPMTGTLNDTTPDVTNVSWLQTANTLATTITSFDSGFLGQVLVFSATDANTTVKDTAFAPAGGNIHLVLSAAKPATVFPTIFIYDGTFWQESRTI